MKEETIPFRDEIRGKLDFLYTEGFDRQVLVLSFWGYRWFYLSDKIEGFL